MTRNTFIEAMKTEQRRIQRLVDLSIPEKNRGVLVLDRRGNHLYAYERWQKKGEPTKKKYLGTLTSDSAREIFNGRLNADRVQCMKTNQKLLQKLEQRYLPDDFDSLVANMPRAYRTIAKANAFDKRYEELREWADTPYPKNSYPFPRTEIYAEDGTRVRSKGECIFYNMLKERGILFRYDCQLEITDSSGNIKILCPDFLIQCYDGTFIIIEHLGRMGDIKYGIDFGEKCYWYLQADFVLGRNFFVTSDDLEYGTDSQIISRVVDKIERMFFGY